MKTLHLPFHFRRSGRQTHHTRSYRELAHNHTWILLLVMLLLILLLAGVARGYYSIAFGA